jgi:hypothetical protein
MTNLDTWTLETQQIEFWSHGTQEISRSLEHPLSGTLLKHLSLNRIEPGQPICPGLSRWMGLSAPLGISMRTSRP